MIETAIILVPALILFVIVIYFSIQVIREVEAE